MHQESGERIFDWRESKAGEKHRACGIRSRPPPIREAEAGEKSVTPRCHRLPFYLPPLYSKGRSQTDRYPFLVVLNCYRTAFSQV